MRAPLILALGCALATAGCHKKPERSGLDAVDNELVNGSVTAESRDAKALRDAIRVDAGGAGTTAGGGACLTRYGDKLAEGTAWAGKLPPELPAPPQARIVEAAGHDGGCSIRIVSYRVPGDAEGALGWYAGKAKAGGYTADRGDTGGDKVLAGTKGEAAFYVMAGAPQAGATPVDLVWATTG